MYHWGKIIFLDFEIDTDLLLFRERSMLLVPDSHEENRFVVLSSSEGTEFIVGSSTEGQYELLKSFFQRVYPCSIQKCEPPDGFVEGKILLNSRKNRKREDFYYPSFMRNIINIPSMIPDVKLQYQTVVRSSVSLFRRKKYSFAVLIGYTGNAESLKAVEAVITDEVLRLKRRFGWKFRVMKKNARLRSFSMTDSFNLSSFMRITSDEDLV